MADNYALDWHGDDVKNRALEQLRQVMEEFAGTVEGESKGELWKGHGVLTGTLRRSIIHTPAVREGSTVSAKVGAWVHYAMAVHQGFGSFGGYHYIRNGLDKSKAQLRQIVGRHAL